MGRNLKIGILNWNTRNYIYRRAELNKSHWRNEYISNILPFGTEYHFLSNGKLKIILSVSRLNQKIFQDYFTHISERRDISSIEFILQELPYNYLSPILLAKSIAGRLSPVSGGGFNDINYWLENELKKIQGNDIGINGLRIEIKGITGKMTMSKKIIKTYGTLKFNSSDSIIDVGSARNYNSRGILGVKIWMSFSPES